MRNPLKRLARPDQAKRPLRERLAGAKTKLVAVREKYGRTLRVHRALNAPLPIPAPAVDRVALVNYATFLALERDRVCAELYPHMGVKGSRFVLSMNEAWIFFRDGDNSAVDRVDVPPASTRALKVLDLVGIDWRKDATENGRKFFDEGGRADTGERPAVPYGFPTLDAELTEALDDLTRLDAAIEAMHSGNTRRTGDLLPGFEGLERGRNEALDRLVRVRAKGLPGLQAKAHAILTDSVTDHLEDIASSLARDLIGARPSTLDQHRPDPIVAAIAEVKRLEALAEAHEAGLPAGVDVSPEFGSAVWDYVNGTLLKTVPTTAQGCKALAAFVPAFLNRWGAALDEDKAAALFALIACSPLRA